jgi:hypothetical protein
MNLGRDSENIPEVFGLGRFVVTPLFRRESSFPRILIASRNGKAFNAVKITVNLCALLWPHKHGLGGVRGASSR